MKFTIYQIDTGRVAFGGMSQNPELLLLPGQALLQDQDFTDGWLDGGQHFTPPSAPTLHHVFNYTTKQWEDPRTAATEWIVVRARRGSLLSGTDWVVTKAVEAGNPVPEAWTTYRQALRDVTKQADPFALVWPSPP